MRAGAVVVHWRGMADTRECLESLAADGGDTRIIVVVNGPGDFDEEIALRACAKAEIVRSERNLGYGGGCNLGARVLLEGEGVESIVFLNNDVVAPPRAIPVLADALASQPDAGVMGPVVVYHDDPGRVWSAGGRVNRWFGYTRHIGLDARAMPERIRAVDYVNGSVMAVDAALFRDARGFDESYFHYFEDADFCEAMRGRGRSCYVTPEVVVAHKVSASIGRRGSNELTRRQAYYFSRNRMLFVRRRFAGLRRVVALGAQPLLFLYEAAKAMRQGRGDAARGHLAGLVAGIRGATGADTSSAP